MARALDRKNLVNLPAISTRIATTIEKSQRNDTSNLLRNFTSQSVIRKELNRAETATKPRTSASLEVENNTNDLAVHKRIPSYQTERKAYNLNQQVITEPVFDEEYGFDPNDLLLGAKVLAKSNSKSRLKVTKVNRIKVISALPNTDNRMRTEETMSVTNSIAEDRGLRIDTKIKDMINSNIEDLRLGSKYYPSSTYNRTPGLFMFPESTPNSACKFQSPSTAFSTDDELPAIMPTLTSGRRTQSSTVTKPTLTLEPIKVFHEITNPMKEHVDNIVKSTRFYPESAKNVSTPSARSEFGLSPSHKTGLNILTLKVPVRKESLENYPFMQKKVSIKFRNEEALLNKLFRTVNNQK